MCLTTYPSYVHCIVKVNMGRANKQTQSHSKSTRVRWEKVDKVEYRAILNKRLMTISGEADTVDSLNNEIQKLNEVLASSTKLLAPTVTKPAKKPKLQVWTPEIQQAIKEKKKAFGNGSWEIDLTPKKTGWLSIGKLRLKIFVNSVGSKAPLSDRLQDRKSLTPNMKIPSYSID